MGTKCLHTRACTKAVTLMDDNGVKWVPVADRFSYPPDTQPSQQLLRHVSDCYRIVML